MNESLETLRDEVFARNPGEAEFHQAVREVVDSLKSVVARRPEYLEVFERLCEPERQLIFRVPWVDDNGEVRVNRGFRYAQTVSAAAMRVGDAVKTTVARPSRAAPSRSAIAASVTESTALVGSTSTSVRVSVASARASATALG